ncbi:hypothetical protein CLV86_1755 [Lacinutrix venerupis]|uniref:Lipoprotein n=1 Tax=Lacinutrix venerupis TaxID=1486034 RepID=A0AAC9LK49_9FLAO|nr:hypothetical protein [Lacinutrix venerupis]APX98834.1 hypothetical protein BWR22_00440 [Lacinutrix venerupis]RLJ63219.1 hypothetical protein CLV86_1755 [Lacinutrix venerupis]
MKKIIVLIIGLILFSCSTNDDSFVMYQDPMPVESVILPDEFVLNETYEITVTYLKPTSCHTFSDIFYKKNQNNRTVVIIGTVFQNNTNCEELNTPFEASFNFTATETGSYVFKFWESKNDEGEDVYLTIEVPVLG